MVDDLQQRAHGKVARCLEQASSYLAACSRPDLRLSSDSSVEQLSSALTALVSAAEFFSCQPQFWRFVADAAALLGRDADAAVYRSRLQTP